MPKSPVLCWQRDFNAPQRSAVRVSSSILICGSFAPTTRRRFRWAADSTRRIAQYQVASIISPDAPWLRALEGACQAMLGRRRDARAMLEGSRCWERTDASMRTFL